MKLSIFHGGRMPSKSGEFLPDLAPVSHVAGRIESEFSRLRERILTLILALTGLVGVIVYLVNLPALVDLARDSQWSRLAVYSLICLLLLLAAFVRRIPYKIRAIAFLFILFAFSLVATFTAGLYALGFIFLIVLPVFAGFLLGSTGRVNALIISVATMLSIGLVLDSQVLQSTISGGIIPTGFTTGHPWLVASCFFSLLTIAVTLSLSTLIREMENGLRARQSTLQELEGERLHLENQMQQNTRDLERRLVQIRTAAEITGSISRGGVTVPLHELLPQVCELILDRFDLYYVGIFIIDKGSRRLAEGERDVLTSPTPREYARLVAGTGEAGERMLAEGYKLEVGGESMVGWCTANRLARIALDVEQEAAQFYNPYLPETRSELALPIYSQEEALGALTIHSREEAAFDKDDVAVMQGIADNLASAIVNARLFAETQTSLDEIQTLHQQYLEKAWVETLQAQGALQYTFYSPLKIARLSESLPVEEAVEPASQQIGQISSTPTPARLRTLRLPIKLRDQVIGALTLEAETRSEAVVSTQDGSQAADWTAEEKAFIEAVMDQAALALENARLLDETRRRAEQERLSAGIAGKVWASSSVDKILQTALQELSASLGVSEGTIRLEVKE